MVHGAITWRGPTTTRRLHPLLFRCTMPALISTLPPLPQVRALALLEIAAAVRSGRALSAAPPCEEEGYEGRGRSGEPFARRCPFSWEALFPPTEEAPEGDEPHDEPHLPSAGQLAFFATALTSVAVDAAERAADKAELADQNCPTPPGEAPPPPSAASPVGGGAAEGPARACSPSAAAGLGDGAAPSPHAEGEPARVAREAAAASAEMARRSLVAASRAFTRGAGAAIELLTGPAAVAAASAPPEEAALHARLTAARVAVILENLAGRIHAKHLRAFLREEAAAATGRGGAAAQAQASAGGAAVASLELRVAAASQALVSAWGRGAFPEPDAGPLSWPGVSAGPFKDNWAQPSGEYPCDVGGQRIS